VFASHVPFEERYPTLDDLLGDLDRADPNAVTVAVDIMSRIDPEATMATALEWFQNPDASELSQERWRVGGWALGRSRADQALGTLLRALQADELPGYGVFEPNAHPDLCTRLLEIVATDRGSDDAFSILGIIKDRRAVRPLMDMLTNIRLDRAARTRAAGALGEIGGAVVQRRLASLFAPTDGDLREAVVEAAIRARASSAFDVLAPYVDPKATTYDGDVARCAREVYERDVEAQARHFPGEMTGMSLDKRWRRVKWPTGTEP
jgi:hypothetical protein